MGNDSFRMAEQAKVIVDGLLPADSRVVGLETIDGRGDANASIQAVSASLQALRSVSLFGGNRVVWLRDATFLAAEKGGGERGADEEGADDVETSSPIKGVLADLAACIKSGLPDGLTFLLTAAAVDKRSALYRAFDTAGRVENLGMSEKSWEAEKQARNFLDEQIEARRLRMPEDARLALMRRAGTDTQTLANEVEKLSLYSANGSVTAADVMSVAVSSREAILWDLTDAIGARNVTVAFEVMRQLLFQRESPMAVIAVIEGYFRKLAATRDVLDRKWATLGNRELEWRQLSEAEVEMLAALGKANPRTMKPFAAFKLAQQATRRTAQNIRRCRREILAAHERLVSSTVPQALTLDFMLRQLLA